MLADMYELAEKHQAQLVVCGFYIDTYCGQNHLSEKICVDDRVFTDAKIFGKRHTGILTETCCIHRGINCTAWM